MHLKDKPSRTECCQVSLMLYPLLQRDCSTPLPWDKPKGPYNLTAVLNKYVWGTRHSPGVSQGIHAHRGSCFLFLGNQTPWASTAQISKNPDPQLQAVHGASSLGARQKQQQGSKKSSHTVLSLLGRFNMCFFWGICKYNSRITGKLLDWEHQCRKMWTPSSEDNINCQVRKFWIYNFAYFRNLNLGQIG